MAQNIFTTVPFKSNKMFIIFLTMLQAVEVDGHSGWSLAKMTNLHKYLSSNNKFSDARYTNLDNTIKNKYKKSDRE